MDKIGIDGADLDDLLHFNNRDLASRRHHGIEVAGGLTVDHIALAIRLPGLDDRQVCSESRLHHIVLAIEAANFLTVRDDSTDTGFCEERRDAGSARSDPLSKSALWIELEFRSEEHTFELQSRQYLVC